MTTQSKFAQRVFFYAAIYGMIVLIPQYFLESKLSPPTTHPEQFYGFIGIALAWQFVFIIISRDVVRYRLLMLVAVLEKLAFGVPAWILYLQERAPVEVVAVGSIDLLLGALFASSFFKTRAIGGGQKAA
jgi:hypothetical protein